MHFPSRPPHLAQCDVAIMTALGATPREVYRARDLLAVFDAQQEVEALQPDFRAIILLDTFAVIASAPAGKKKLHARQLSRRRGEIFCEHRGEQIEIAGRVVEYLRGHIFL
jgi:predicted PhzF superfamily epimerase YddE/YHI9